MRNYDNAYLVQFEANIINKGEDKNGLYVVLDRTFFFPEGGGQGGDKGKINDIICTDTKEENGIIKHYVVSYPQDSSVKCEIDFYNRFRRMQNHTGEHIVSGIIHNLYGYNNVGFHLGDDDVTCDFDHELTKENIEKIEQLANKIVFENRNVNIFYPTGEELSSIEYRSKLELTEDVRIVEIDGVDKCACCAPHVLKTGEIGLIKILNPTKWKSGTRIHLKCGYDALYDYNSRYDQSVQISTLLKVKQEEIFEGVLKLYNDSIEKDHIINNYKKEKVNSLISTLTADDNSIIVLSEDTAMDGLTSIVNAGATLSQKYCIALSSTSNGFRFALKSNNSSVKDCIKAMKNSLVIRGGGTDDYASGAISSSIEEVKAFFTEFDKSL